MKRREFLKIGFSLLGAGLLGAETAAAATSQPSRRNEFETFLTADGITINLLLGSHDFDGTVHKEQVLPAHLFPENNTGIFVEGSALAADPMMAMVNIRQIANTPNQFYSSVMRHGLATGQTLFYGDLQYTSIEAQRQNRVRSIFKDISIGALPAVILAAVLGKEYATNPWVKAVLEATSTASIGASIYALSPNVVKILRLAGMKPEDSIGFGTQAVIADIFQPHNTQIVMRNIVWALKIIDLYEEGFLRKHEILTLVGGARHVFVRFFIEHPEFAKWYWQTFNYTTEASKRNYIPTSIYQTHVLSLASGSAYLIEHAELKKMVEAA